MAKLITTVQCKYTGDLAEHKPVEELKSGGFREIKNSRPHYQAVHKLEIKIKHAVQFMTLVEIKHKETIQGMSDAIEKDLKSGGFEMISVNFEIGE